MSKKKATKDVLVECDNCHDKFPENRLYRICYIKVCNVCFNLFLDWADDMLGTDFD
jgi:formylmethanofuran dehydrogenase subunit E